MQKIIETLEKHPVVPVIEIKNAADAIPLSTLRG